MLYSSVPTTAANAGSAALTIWPKLTEPADMANTEPACAPATQMATGTMRMKSCTDSLGRSRASGASHRYRPYTAPTASCAVASVIGKPSAPPEAFSARLFAML